MTSAAARGWGRAPPQEARLPRWSKDRSLPLEDESFPRAKLRGPGSARVACADERSHPRPGPAPGPPTDQLRGEVVDPEREPDTVGRVGGCEEARSLQSERVPL